MKTKKIKTCFFTASRSEYGLLKKLMTLIKNDPSFLLQLIVSGTHTDKDHGKTKEFIEEDEFKIDYSFDMHLGEGLLTDSMAICLKNMGTILSTLNPDMLIILGDRYELLSACSAALVQLIPIVHISGGDLTEGCIDNQVRNAITKMASLHFPGTEQSRQRIIQMGEDPSVVFNVGEPGIDNIISESHIDRIQLASSLKIDPSKKWVLCTYHPETQNSLKQDLDRCKNIIEYFSKRNDIELVITSANADEGGAEINHFFSSSQKISNTHYFTSLGLNKYINMIRHSDLLIGNSSSIIVESPTCKKPAINIGDRQKGRIFASNILHSDGTQKSIEFLSQKALRNNTFLTQVQETINPFGPGNSAEKMIEILKNVDLSTRKGFYEIKF